LHSLDSAIAKCEFGTALKILMVDCHVNSQPRKRISTAGLYWRVSTAYNTGEQRQKEIIMWILWK